MIKTGIGQDSHRIQEPANGKVFVLGGLKFDEPFALEGNSDSDVILHAITNAISGITCKPILGPVADDLCKSGIINSSAYLRLALEDLYQMKFRLVHVSISLECLRPKILPKLPLLRTNLAVLLNLTVNDIGITATSGEGLTDFGKGLGIQAFAVVTAEKVA